MGYSDERTTEHTSSGFRWPSEECLRSIPSLALNLSRFLRSNLRLSTEPEDVPFKAPHAVSGGIDRELDQLCYPLYGRTIEQYEAVMQESARRGWLFSIAYFVLATPVQAELDELFDEVHQKPFRTALATYSGGQLTNVMHSSCLGWGNEVSAALTRLFELTATLRVYFHKGPVFSRASWIGAGDWLWNYVEGPGIGTGSREPWFTSGLCRTPGYNAKLPKRFLSPAAATQPPRLPVEIERHGTIESPRTQGFPTAWLDQLDMIAADLEHATSDIVRATLGAESTPISRCPVRLSDPEKTIVIAILELRAAGVTQLSNATISKRAGLTEQRTKELTGPMKRHGILDENYIPTEVATS